MGWALNLRTNALDSTTYSAFQDCLQIHEYYDNMVSRNTVVFEDRYAKEIIKIVEKYINL